ncbi:DUF2971 domain-containing protein [Aeromonas veronii]
MKVLYKYYSNKFDIIDHLENPSIKLASTKHFNDPFESTLSETLATKLSEGLRLFANIQDDSQYENVYKEIYTNIPQHYGIVCLTENHRNILMWAHYASSHQGFCIGYKHDFIEKSFKANEIDKLFGATNPLPQRVIYDTRRFDINKFNDAPKEEQIPIKFIMEKMLIKSNEWIYEKEHRCIIPFQYGELIKVIRGPSPKTKDLIQSKIEKRCLKRNDKDNEYSFDKMPDLIHNSSIYELAQQEDIILLKKISLENIDSIYFGCQCSESVINDTIKILAQDKYKHIKAYRYHTNNDTFDINEVRLA